MILCKNLRNIGRSLFIIIDCYQYATYDRNMPFTDALFYITFRKYQEDMLKTFEEQKKSGETKFHFVAPPGSGKTIICLEIIRRIGEKAVVFSPNQAIQSQWLTRLKELTDDIKGSVDPFSNAELISLT